MTLSRLGIPALNSCCCLLQTPSIWGTLYCKYIISIVVLVFSCFFGNLQVATGRMTGSAELCWGSQSALSSPFSICQREYSRQVCKTAISICGALCTITPVACTTFNIGRAYVC